MYIKDRNSEQIFNVEVSVPVWRSVVRLSGTELPTKPLDFNLYTDEDSHIDIFEGFNTIYDSGDGYVEYTNDSNKYYNYFKMNENNYITDIIITTEELVDNNIHLHQSGQGKKYKTFSMELYNEDDFFLYKIENGELVETSDEEREAHHVKLMQMELETNKLKKINESKKLLADYLESHPLVSDCHNGIVAKYNVTSDKQSLMASNYLTYTIAKATGLDAKLTWNASGCECEEWTEEQYVTLVLQISEYVKPLVSLQQSYEVIINNCMTQEELDSIEIVYC